MAISEEKRQQIFEAADTLVERGERPTQEAVRDVLGGGSYTQISQGMKAWWEARKPRPEVITVPSELMEQSQSLVREIWTAAQQHSQAQLDSEREALQEAQAQIEEAQLEAAYAADRATEEAERLKGELERAMAAEEAERQRAEQAAGELERERNRAEQAETERDRLAQQVGDQRQHMERLMRSLERMASPGQVQAEGSGPAPNSSKAGEGSK